MGLRFIREPSETPNVGNFDDARMIRYAYGGYDGYVKNKGAELSHSIAGTTFRINSGVVSLQGYETEVDANGWELDVGMIPTKRYYSVFYEVNLATQTVKFDSLYNTSTYPSVNTGDDLTQASTGIARMMLYRFTATNGVIAEVVKFVQVIKYSQTLLSEERTAWQAAISTEQTARQSGDTSIRNELGNGTLVARNAQYSTTQASGNNSTLIATTAFVKNALTASLGSISYSNISNAVGSVYKLGNLVFVRIAGTVDTATSSTLLATISSGYRPSSTASGKAFKQATNAGSYNFTINTSGQLYLSSSNSGSGTFYFDAAYISN